MERDELMVIDIGNTQTGIGFWKAGTIVDAYRFQSDRDRTADEWGLWFRWVLQANRGGPDRLRGVAIASVVPPMTDRIVQACQKYLGQTPFVIEPGIRTGMPILYEDPKAVGADRIANAVAAFRELGGPCVVIDLGTATTFDIVSERGEYLGGVIAPGIEISADALFQRAARLPRVEVRRPPGVIGRNTPHAMQAGLFYGYAGLIERIGREIQAVLGKRTQFIATGGLAPLLADTSPYMQRIDPLLTLRGIAYLYEMNQPE
jgi:type III pantothenate kinase